MVYRNCKGQILLESILLVMTFSTMLILFQHMLEQQKTKIKDYQLSKETNRSLKYENVKIKSAN